MKQILLALLVLLCCTAFNISINAQCDKNLVLASSKTEYLNAAGVVQKTVDQKTRIDITPKSITISPDSDRTMTGEIASVTCAWKIAFQEGKSEFKTKFEDQGEAKHITITLEGKNGKVCFLAVFDDTPDKRIRVWLDSFKENK